MESSCSELWAASEGSLEGRVYVLKASLATQRVDRQDSGGNRRALSRATDFPPHFRARGSPLEALGGQKEPPKSSRTLEGVLALATFLLKSTQLKSLLSEPQFFHL